MRIEEIAREAVKIYFDYNCTAKEAIEKAIKVYKGESEVDCETCERRNKHKKAA